MKFSLATLLKAITLIAVALGVIMFCRNYFQAHQTGVPSTVANRMIWQEYRLPETATDVTYHSDFGGCEAEFSISENDFLQWCELQGWAPIKIDNPMPYFQPVLLPENMKPVSRGYTFNIPHGRGVFDTEQERAAFWASTFP